MRIPSVRQQPVTCRLLFQDAQGGKAERRKGKKSYKGDTFEADEGQTVICIAVCQGGRQRVARPNFAQVHPIAIGFRPHSPNANSSPCLCLSQLFLCRQWYPRANTNSIQATMPTNGSLYMTRTTTSSKLNTHCRMELLTHPAYQ